MEAIDFLDGLKNRQRVVVTVIDVAFLGEWTNHECWNARAVAPDSLYRWRYMVPPSAMLVVGNDNERLIPIRACLHGGHDIGNVLLAGQQVCIPGVLIIWAQRFNEGNRRKRTVLQVREKVVLVLQVRCGYRVPLAVYPGRIVVVIRKR